MSRRERLRPAHTAARLAEIYPVPHQHQRWADHQLRVALTIQLARAVAGAGPARAADLSCGDGAILDAIPAQHKIYGDLAPGWPVTGPIEQTLHGVWPVDVWVLAETLEHLDDPDLVLAQLRARTATLILSTPIGAWDDRNVEHYWAWDRPAVEAMLAGAGFRPLVFTALDVRPARADYCYGIWGCQ